MYGVVEIGGKQYNVKKGDIIAVDKLDKNKDETVEFNNVILIKDKEVLVGDPYIKNAKIKAKVIDHQKDKKTVVFKFKRKKNYKVLKGHRQPYTMVKIEGITTK